MDESIEPEPCRELLEQWESRKTEDEIRDAVELVGLFVLVLILVACAFLSVAIALGGALTVMPRLGILAFRRRHRIVALIRKQVRDE